MYGTLRKVSRAEPSMPLLLVLPLTLPMSLTVIFPSSRPIADHHAGYVLGWIPQW